MPPRPIKNIFYPSHEETLPPMIFGKIGRLHRNRFFSAWSEIFGPILELGSRDSVLRVLRWMRDIWLLLQHNYFDLGSLKTS